MGRLFWRFFLIVWLAQLAAVFGTGAVFWLEHRARGGPPGHDAGPRPPPHERRFLPSVGPPPAPAPPLPPAGPPGEFRIPLVPALVGLLASLACAAGLAWYVAHPIRLLRRVFGEIAGGRLDSRIAGEMGRRRDELADLGQDFDRMAGHLQSVVLGQRRLLHDVSHEMRSPLARLQAAIGLARQQPERVQELLERIEREGERLDALVGEVLALARAESGAARKERFELRELLLTLVDDARFEGAARKLALVLDCPAGIQVEAAPELLHAAIDNVLRNGLRFSPDGGELQISCRVLAGIAHIDVADRGPGVAEALLPHIFTPFIRGAASERSGEGYGLGLAIAQRALAASGGRIEATNREGGGLRVSLQLPVLSAPPLNQPVPD